MDTRRQAPTSKEHDTRTFASTPLRLAGLSAIVAGISFMVVGLFHPLHVLSAITTARWEFVHILATAMCFFGLLGITGLYARQAKQTGWLGLAGVVVLTFWLVLTAPFTFFEAFILPPLATAAPSFAEGFLSVFTGAATQMDMGALPTLWVLSGASLVLGGLLFGIATFRAAILSRWAGGLLAVGVVATFSGALLPEAYKPFVAVPVGFALAWLGYSLWSERREPTTEPVVGRGGTAHLRPTGAE